MILLFKYPDPGQNESDPFVQISGSRLKWVGSFVQISGSRPKWAGILMFKYPVPGQDESDPPPAGSQSTFVISWQHSSGFLLFLPVQSFCNQNNPFFSTSRKSCSNFFVIIELQPCFFFFLHILLLRFSYI